MTDRVYCCEHSSSEPLAGTADEVELWLMLEYRPVWGPKALADNELSAPVRGWLAAQLDALRARGLKVRAQFIRQPEIDRRDTRLLIAHRDRLVELSSTGYGQLIEADVRDLVESGRELTEPHYFVCTNGQRDFCCARHGLPAYQALRERLGERVWQTTHIGGHRFAPNVLVLPQGALYGRLHPDAVGEFVATVERGELDFTHLRGRTCYPGMVQAAEASIARSDLTEPSIENRGAHARVVFAVPEGEVAAEMRVADPIGVLASCGDRELKTVRPWVSRAHTN